MVSLVSRKRLSMENPLPRARVPACWAGCACACSLAMDRGAGSVLYTFFFYFGFETELLIFFFFLVSRGLVPTRECAVVEAVVVFVSGDDDDCFCYLCR